MYAVIKTGGKQYKVQPGGIVEVEKLDGEEGSAVSFNEVLLFADGDNLSLGTPVLGNVTVRGTILKQARAKKILIFKFRRRKHSRKSQGHRQPYSVVKIDSIEA